MIPTAATDWNSPRAWAIDLAICLLAGGLLGVLGPFGSYLNDGPVLRVGYWVAMFALSGVVYGLAIRRLQPMAVRARVPAWVWVPAMVLVLNLPLGAVSRMTALVLWPGLGDLVGPVEWFAQSLLVSMAFTSAFVFLRFRPEMATGSGRSATGRDPALGFRDDLLCLQMEDHYVRVHTPDGSRLVLMPLGQAMAEAGVEGMRVHRSWWVARHAVAEVRTEGRNLRLVLTGGIEAPVARASVARLRAAGWLDARDHLAPVHS